MAVYFFTLHAYRSWSADNPRGFVQHDQGIQAPNRARAAFYDKNGSQEAVRFAREHQEVIAWIVADACLKRNWRLHGLGFEDTHVHILVSWREFQDWHAVRAKLKNLSSLELGRFFQSPGRLWFAREGSRRRVHDRKHFEHLMNCYLPKHQGLVWREGDPLLQKPEKPWTAVLG